MRRSETLNIFGKKGSKSPIQDMLKVNKISKSEGTSQRNKLNKGSKGEKSPGGLSFGEAFGDQDSSLATETESDEDFLECPVYMKDCWKGWSKWYAKNCLYKCANYIVMSKIFNYIILLSILVNTIALALDEYPIDREKIRVMEFINLVMTFIFIGEMAIKIIGLGIATYCSRVENLFDAFIVIMSVVELAISTEGGSGTFLSIFRGTRLFRVFRLFSQWESFHKMMVKIAISLKDLLSFFVLLLLIVLVFSLLGVEFFAQYIKIDDEGNIVQKGGKSPRLNFDTPAEAFVTVFTCMIGDDWNFIMHNYMRAKRDLVLPPLFFLVIMIFGHLFIMSLFLAILLKNFEDKK